MHEFAPRDRSHLSRDGVLALLNQLLESERAGARGVGELGRAVAAPSSRTILRDIARDEARYCAMLTHHITRLGGAPSRTTGAFYEKLLAQEGLSARLDLLDRGQGWVVRKLREALPRICDKSLHADLTEMLETHERNIERCGSIER